MDVCAWPVQSHVVSSVQRGTSLLAVFFTTEWLCCLLAYYFRLSKGELFLDNTYLNSFYISYLCVH